MLELSPRRLRELLDTAAPTVLPGLMATPMLGAGNYGYTQLSANQFDVPNANQMVTSTSGLSVTTPSHTPSANNAQIYICTCRFNAGAPTDITLTDTLGSTYDVVAGPTVQAAAGVGIIQKIFRLRTVTTTSRTLTATVTGGGIASTLGWGIERITVINPSGLECVTTLVETAQAEGTGPATLNAVPYGDLIEVFCISSATGATTPAGSTRFGNASWSNGGNATTSVMRNDVPFSQAAGRSRTMTGATRYIIHVLHVYFRVARTTGLATLELTHQEYTASFTTTTRNYTLQIGPAKSDRIVIVAIHFHPDSTGSAMPLNAAYINSDTTQVGINVLNALPYSNPVPRTIVYWHVPTGTTVPLTLTLGAAATKVALNVWTLRGAKYAMHTDSGQDADTAAITVFSSASRVVKPRGVAVASMNRRTGGIVPANPTVWTPAGWTASAADRGPPGGLQGALSGATRFNGSASSNLTETPTATFSVSSSNGGSMVVASFGP